MTLPLAALQKENDHEEFLIADAKGAAFAIFSAKKNSPFPV